MDLPKARAPTAEPRAPHVPKPRLKFPVAEAGIDLLIELVDHLTGRIPGRTDAVPDARLVARQELPHGWDVRQRLRARRGRYRQRAQPTRPDILDRRDSGGDHDLHMPGDEIGER